MSLLVVQGNDRFLPQLVYDGDLDLALLNVKDRIRRVALRVDFLLRLIRRYGPSPVSRGPTACQRSRDLL
jgi:hypothetical protein